MSKARSTGDLVASNLITTDISNDRIGIGSDTPSSKLDVLGDVNITGVVTATSFVKDGGTSSEFLKADGSVDTNTYLTSYTETQTLNDVLELSNTSDTGLSVGVATATSFIKASNSGGFLKADGTEDTNTYLTSYTETDPIVAAINGIVKSDGTTISAASAGTDYLAPTGDGSGLSGIVTNIQAGANITVLESPAGNFIVTSTASGGGGGGGSNGFAVIAGMIF